jgi:hypothetical protein
MSAPHVWINALIIAKCDSGGNISDVLSTIVRRLPQMNLVNMTTAIHRLGKMVSHDAKAQSQLKQSHIFTDLVVAIAKSLANGNSADTQPQSLSNILWALASIRQGSVQIVRLACERAIPNIERFKPFELSMMLWAISKLATMDSNLHLDEEPAKSMFGESSKYVMERVASIEFRCLSMIVWAYATAKLANHDLFSIVASQMMRTAHTATCQEMGNTVWAFGTFSYTEYQLFNTLAQKGMTEMENLKPQELSNMLWGFASSGFFHETFFQRAASVAATKDLSPQHLANIIWAFSLARPKHPLTQSIILKFLPSCCHQIDDFKPQELSSVIFSVAKAFVPNDEPGQRSELPAEAVRLFRCIPSVLPYEMESFSTQSLINMAAALEMVGLCDENTLLPSLALEALHRARAVQPAELLRLFQVFLAALPYGNYANVVSSMAMILAGSVDNLRQRDARSLSRTCMEYLGFTRGLNRQELKRVCIQLAQKVATSDNRTKCVAKRSALEIELEHMSSQSTRVSSTHPSYLSGNVDDDAASERSWLSSNTMHMPCQIAKDQIRQSFFATSQSNEDSSTCFSRAMAYPPSQPSTTGFSHCTLDLNSAITNPTTFHGTTRKHIHAGSDDQMSVANFEPHLQSGEHCLSWDSSRDRNELSDSAIDQTMPAMFSYALQLLAQKDSRRSKSTQVPPNYNYSYQAESFHDFDAADSPLISGPVSVQSSTRSTQVRPNYNCSYQAESFHDFDVDSSPLSPGSLSAQSSEFLPKAEHLQMPSRDRLEPVGLRRHDRYGDEERHLKPQSFGIPKPPNLRYQQNDVDLQFARTSHCHENLDYQERPATQQDVMQQASYVHPCGVVQGSFGRTSCQHQAEEQSEPMDYFVAYDDDENYLTDDGF